MNEAYVIYDGQNQEFAESADFTTNDLDCAKTFASYAEAETYAEAHWPGNYAILRWM